ncbi:MAG TPA: VanW family protein [Polyangiaceae bacterium]|nr:VanW family protein [Polyangiaceae bacterium]
MIGGLTVAGVSVGGVTSAEAKQRLAERARSLAAEQLRVELGGKTASLPVADAGLELSVDASVARAVGVARSGGTFSNAWRYLSSLTATEELPAVVRIDRARFGAALSKVEGELIEDLPKAGGVVIEAGVARAVPAAPGRKIAVDAALAACGGTIALGQTGKAVALQAQTSTPVLARGSLERALALATRALSRSVTLEAEGRRLELAPAQLGGLLVSRIQGQEVELSIDPARLEAWLATERARLEAPARDAGFEVSSNDEVRVVPGEAGVQLRAEEVTKALWAAVQSDDHRGTLPLTHEPLPARSTEQAEQLGIRKLVGSFTTRHPCCQSRVDNIHRIATLLDGLVVEPGQTVSINAVVGPRTQKNGFVLAPSIEDGEMVDTVGGGVSQFATTIFNALFHAGYDIIERQPHTYWFPRYPMGHDATLGFPRPDIVFKNDSAAGLLIKTSFTKTTITVKLYGDVGGRRVASGVSERREIVKPALELLPNRDVPPDEEEVKEGGMIGWSVIASRTVTFADGTKKEEKRKVTYKPKPRRVEVHPCKIPKGEPGATGEKCPEPELTEEPALEDPTPPLSSGAARAAPPR